MTLFRSTFRANLVVGVAGGASVTTALPDTEGVATLVATTVTVAGAGYGVSYRPVLLMEPALNALPGGPSTDQVTAVEKLPVPVTFAVNC